MKRNIIIVTIILFVLLLITGAYFLFINNNKTDYSLEFKQKFVEECPSGICSFNRDPEELVETISIQLSLSNGWEQKESIKEDLSNETLYNFVNEKAQIIIPDKPYEYLETNCEKEFESLLSFSEASGNDNFKNISKINEEKISDLTIYSFSFSSTLIDEDNNEYYIKSYCIDDKTNKLRYFISMSAPIDEYTKYDFDEIVRDLKIL